MQFKLEKDMYLVIGYPSVSKPFNLRSALFHRLSSAATVWERIQKPAGIYLIKRDNPTQLNTLITKQGFECVVDVIASDDGTRLSIDVCSMTSTVEPRVSFTRNQEVVAIPHVTIRGVPVDSDYFNCFNNTTINVDEAIHTNLSHYNIALQERMKHDKQSFGVTYDSLRATTNLLTEIAIEDKLSLYQGER